MRALLLVSLVAAALFVWFTSGSLPPVVASHFGASGIANGFMPRSAYVGFMLAVVVLVPVLVALSGQLARLLPVSLVSLPNRNYWLAPERKASTARELGALSLYPACIVLIFLCFVHWQVVQANLTASKQMDPYPVWVALGLFTVAVVGWLVLLYRRFGRLPT